MKSCICIVAWHAYPELFETLASLPELDVFVLSHRSPGELPEWITRYTPPGHVFFEQNLGYDWGAYEQFLQKGIYRSYSMVFFAHDDIHILDNAAFETCAEIIRSKAGKCVVGNGRQTHVRDWVRTHTQCYAHSHWKPPSWDFCHDVVRGSFFATSSASLEQIGGFEILWDRRGYFGVGAGNWSLRATCGKIQASLGEDAFHYLSETYLESKFISEMERGQEVNKPKSPSPDWLLRYKLLVMLSRRLMTLYLDSTSISARQKYTRWMEKLFSYL